MENLKWLREQGAQMNRQEKETFVPLTIKESVAEFLLIYKTFTLIQDKRMDDWTREQDEIYFTKMAMRLHRAKRKRTQHGQSFSQRRTLSKAS